MKKEDFDRLIAFIDRFKERIKHLTDQDQISEEDIQLIDYELSDLKCTAHELRHQIRSKQ